MRNLKKFLALVLAMLMIVSASAAVSASDFSDVADDSIYAEAIADLVEKGITNGVAAGQFGPDQPVQRFQMALFMARALEPDVDDWMTGMQVFDDVDEWYGAIAYAYVNNIVTGMGNNLFAPHNGIRYQDALIMALRALGYKVDVSGDPYWLEAYNQAQALGLTKGVEVYVGEQVLTRAETAQIIFNMLYTTPADGGATIAAKNFGEATAANTTTMVVTATPKQAYAESYKAAEEGYLGLQTVVNGLPAGDVLYLPAAVLGVDADDVEAYFGYSFDFVNYDAENGSFDNVMIGEDPVVVYSTDVTKNSNEKITIDGTAYYTVDEFEGAALKNEIVVYNAGDLAYLQKVLYTDKDGNVVNSNGDIVARYSHKSSDGTKFYLDLAANVIITEEAALAKYGIDVADDSYIKYSTLSAKDLDEIGNYQLTLFDDDRDGKFERAIVTNVYMSAFKAKDSGKETFGPMKDEKDVVYTEDLTKGEVFTYTYNSQTKVVTVLDVLDINYGTLTKIDTTKVGDKVVKLTIDGEVYTVANADLAKKTGATIYDYNSNGFDNIAKEAQLGYADYKDFTIGSAIAYYEYNGYIINAKTYPIDEAFDRVVIDQIVSYDSENVYADLYIGGKLVSNVAISNVEGTKISSMNIFQLSRLLSDDAWNRGNVFKAVKLSDGSYQISEELVLSGDDKNVVDFKLVTQTFGTVVSFEDGIADIYNSDNTIARDRVIRSDEKTVFYFLKKNDKGKVVSIATFVGAADNSSIDFTGSDKPVIYADKIGYGNNDSYTDGKVNGVASFVLVYYTDSNDISGFGVANIDYSTVYVVNNPDKVKAYEAASAEELGLVGSDYTGKYFVRYTADGLAVDMSTGKKVNTIYVEVGKEIAADKFYVLSVDNVVLFNKKANVTDAVLKATGFTDARYWTITDVVGNKIVDNTVDKVSSVYLTADTAIDVKTSAKDVLTDGKKYTVKYVPNFTDGTFVGIVVKSEASAPADGTANATWTWNEEDASTKGAVADVKNDATATIQLYEDNAVIGGSVSDKNDSDAAKGTSYDVDLWKWNGVGYQEKAYELNAEATFVDGVLTITDLKSVDGIWDADIEAGRYKVDVTFTVTSGVTVTVTYYAVVK